MMLPMEDGMWFCSRCRSYWYEDQIEAHMAGHEVEELWWGTYYDSPASPESEPWAAVQTLLNTVQAKVREQERVYTAEDRQFLVDCGISTEGL